MLSTLELPFELDAETKSIILTKISNPKTGDEIEVYIPRVMRGITKGKPKVSISPTVYSGAFVNDSSCMPTISETFTEQNFIIGKYENNSQSKGIVTIIRDEHGDIEQLFLEENTEVRCNFINGKLGQLRLNTKDNMAFDNNQYIFDDYEVQGLYDFDFEPYEGTTKFEKKKDKIKKKNTTVDKNSPPIRGGTIITPSRASRSKDIGYSIM